MEKNMVSEKNFTSKALVIKALFAAVLCVSAYISIRFQPVRILHF